MWTVNEAEDMLRVAECGADALITNHPEVARGVLDAR